MADREKVIKGLECHAEVNCVECPYMDGWRACPFGKTLLADAIALLKGQEAQNVVNMRLAKDWDRAASCPKCNESLKWVYHRNYCGYCGQAVKWE